MDFFEIGKFGFEISEGGFEKYFREQAPDMYEGNEDFIHEVDRMIMEYFYAGKKNKNYSPPS